MYARLVGTGTTAAGHTPSVAAGSRSYARTSTPTAAGSRARSPDRGVHPDLVPAQPRGQPVGAVVEFRVGEPGAGVDHRDGAGIGRHPFGEQLRDGPVRRVRRGRAVVVLDHPADLV